MSRDRRRGLRVDASFFCEVVGPHAENQLRVGDVSQTGTCFKADVTPGVPGSVHLLRLETNESTHRTEVLARLVRVEGADDVRVGWSTQAIAFEFLPRSEGERASLRSFVQAVARTRSSGDTEAGATLPLEGALSPLSVEERGHFDLVGSLRNVAVPCIFGFLELERLEGLLRVASQSRELRVWVRRGTVVNATLCGEEELEPMDALSRIFRWTEGTFSFQVCPVDVPARIEQGITAVLLELSRRDDEAILHMAETG